MFFNNIQVERGRPKCDMYWPNEGSEKYGNVVVKHLKTISRAHYTVRLFSLKSCKNKKVSVLTIIYQKVGSLITLDHLNA